MSKYNYFDDFTDAEREMVKRKQISEGQTWKEIIKRFGHPRDWEEGKPKQLGFEI